MSKTMLCVFCGRRKAWPEGFPCRWFAQCSGCIEEREAEERARRAARRRGFVLGFRVAAPLVAALSLFAWWHGGPLALLPFAALSAFGGALAWWMDLPPLSPVEPSTKQQEIAQ